MAAVTCNGKVIRESQVILEYLEDAFPEPTLRPSYTEAIVDWGDTTSQKRVELGTQAFPKVKQPWDAK